jgi:hypothetical protein
MENAGLNTRKCDSLQELLEIARKERILESDAIVRELEQDAWNRTFSLRKTNPSPSVTLVRILSTGPDGICHDGGGDDMYIEIEIDTGGANGTVVRGRPPIGYID